MADFYELIALIQKDHPDIFAILNQPGILEVALQIVQAEIDQRPWTSNQINAALAATPYYQNTPAAGREYTIRYALDPATAKQIQSTRAFELINWAHANGLGMTLDEAVFIAGVGLSNGETLEQTIANTLRTRYSEMLTSGQQGVSPIGDQMQELSAAYGIPWSPLSHLDWQRQIMMGEVTMDTYQSYLVEQAKSLYPGLTDALDAGITVRQYADPYAQIASRELGINPADFDLSDPKWSAPLTQIDPKTGARTAMTLSSWQSMIRSDSQYGYDTTVQARDQAAQFATNLAEQFGAKG